VYLAQVAHRLWTERTGTLETYGHVGYASERLDVDEAVSANRAAITASIRVAGHLAMRLACTNTCTTRRSNDQYHPFLMWCPPSTSVPGGLVGRVVPLGGLAPRSRWS
jgi:hypothetical protein